MSKPPVFIGCDHSGLELKEHLKGALEKAGYLVRDFGAHTRDAVDYPDIAYLVARAVAWHVGRLQYHHLTGKYGRLGIYQLRLAGQAAIRQVSAENGSARIRSR